MGSKKPQHRIEVFVDRIEQLFNSMDPSPFHDKDLDDDAKEFIVGWAQEYPRRDPVALLVHVNQLPRHGDAQQLVETAVHNSFAYRAKLNRREFRHLLKEGRTSLTGPVRLPGKATSRNEAGVLSGIRRVRPLMQSAAGPLSPQNVGATRSICHEMLGLSGRRSL